MEGREDEREERWAASLQLVSTQEPRKLVRETDVPYINDDRLNYHTSGLRSRLQESLQPAAGCIINLAMKRRMHVVPESHE